MLFEPFDTNNPSASVLVGSSNENQYKDNFNSQMQVLSDFCTNQAFINFYSAPGHGYTKDELKFLIDVFELFLYLSILQNNQEAVTKSYIAIAQISQEPDYLLIKDYYEKNPLVPSSTTPDLYSEYCIKSLDEAMDTIREFGTHYYEAQVGSASGDVVLSSHDFDFVIQAIQVNLDFFQFLDSVTFDEDEEYNLESETGIIYFLKFVVLATRLLIETMTQKSPHVEQLAILKESIFVSVKECSKYLNIQISPASLLINNYTLLISHVKTLFSHGVFSLEECIELITIFSRTKAYQLADELPLFQFFQGWLEQVEPHIDAANTEQKKQLLNLQRCLEERNRQVETRLQNPGHYDCADLFIEDSSSISVLSHAQKLDLITSYCTSNERISFFNTEQLDDDLVTYNREIYQYFLDYAREIKDLRKEITAKTVLTLLNKYPSASSQPLDNSSQMEAESKLDSILLLCKQAIKKRLMNARKNKHENNQNLSFLVEEIEASRIYLGFIEELHQKTIDLATIIIFLDRIMNALDLFHSRGIDNKIGLFLQRGVLYGLRAALINFNQVQKPNTELVEKVQLLSHKSRNLTFAQVLDPACIISILEGFLSIKNDGYIRQRIRISHCWDLSRLVYLVSNAWDAQSISLFHRLHLRIELKELEFNIHEKIQGELTMDNLNQFFKTLARYINCAGEQDHDEQLVQDVISYCKTMYQALDIKEKPLFKKEAIQLKDLLLQRQAKHKTAIRAHFITFFQTLFVVVTQSSLSKKKKVAPKKNMGNGHNRRVKKAGHVPPQVQELKESKACIPLLESADKSEEITALPEMVEPVIIKISETKEDEILEKLTLDITEQIIPHRVMPKVFETTTLEEELPDFFQELVVKAENLNHAFKMYRDAEQRIEILRQDLMQRRALLSQPMTMIERMVHLGNSRYNSISAQEAALQMLSHNAYDLYLQFESHYLGVNRWLFEQIQEKLQPIDLAKNEIISQAWLVHYSERYRRQVLLKPKERELLESIESNINLLQDKPELIIDLLRIKAKYDLMLLEHVGMFLNGYARSCLKNALTQVYKIIMDKVWKGFELPAILPFYHELHRYNLFFELFPKVLDLIEGSGHPKACLANIEEHLNNLSLIPSAERNKDLLFKKVFKESEPQQVNTRYNIFAPVPRRPVQILDESEITAGVLSRC